LLFLENNLSFLSLYFLGLSKSGFVVFFHLDSLIKVNQHFDIIIQFDFSVL